MVKSKCDLENVKDLIGFVSATNAADRKELRGAVQNERLSQAEGTGTRNSH